jgi:branched-chain amino acid transport system substrate-binding protein
MEERFKMRPLKLFSILVVLALVLAACAPAVSQPIATPPTAAPAATDTTAPVAPAATDTAAPAPTEAPMPTDTTAPAAPAGELKIAILAPLSGPVPTFGVSTRDGALLAIKEWNAKGGVLGMKITPIIEDSQCTPDPAVNAANKVIEQDKVHYIVGEVCSKASIPVSEIANAKKVIQISPTSTNTGVTVDANGKTKDYIYRACFIDPFQGLVGAKFALENLKAKSAFIMVDQSNDYVKGLAQAFEENFTKGGGTIVGKENYTGTDTDFSAILSKVSSAKPDMVYLPDYYNVVNLATKQAKEKGINVPFMGGDGWDSPDLDLASAAGGYFTNHYSPEDPRTEVQDFLKAYGADYKDDAGAAKVPDALAALAYDATNLLLTAIQSAGADDTDKVKTAMNAINFAGVSGNITFDASHNPIKSATILVVKPEGVKFEAVVNP